MKKYLFSFTLAALFFGITPAHSSGEARQPFNLPPNGYFGLNADPNFLHTFTAGFLTGHVTKDPSSRPSQILACKGLDDPACKDVTFWRSNGIYPQCSTDSQNDCIEAITASKDDGTELKVTVAQTFPGARAQDYVGDENLRLPPGGSSFLVRIPEAPHAAGDLYLPIVNPSSVMNRTGLVPASSFKGDFNVSLYAVKIVNGNFGINFAQTDTSYYQSSFWGATTGGQNPEGCIMNDRTVCAVPVEIPMGIKFGMKIRTSNELKGWFTGRISNQEINLDKVSDKKSILTIKGFPVAVPSIYFIQEKTKFPASFWKYYESIPKPWGGTGETKLEVQNQDPSTWSLIRDMTGYSQNYMDEFVNFLPITGDKSTASPTLWSLSSIANTNDSNQSCSTSSGGVIGVVSTNATQYIDGPPTFNPQDQSLNYKVASTHFNEKGEVNKGTYDLAIKADEAKCIYGFKGNIVSAKIEITNESGTNQIATTTVIQKNGWFYLSAKGFTYSNPTLKVKFEEEKVVEPQKPAEAIKPAEQVKPAPAPSSSAINKTITCIKGKLSKKVSAINPKCPSGYKKK